MTTTFGASDGPQFQTRITYSICPPGATGSLPSIRLLISRSAWTSGSSVVVGVGVGVCSGGSPVEVAVGVVVEVGVGVCSGGSPVDVAVGVAVAGSSSQKPMLV